MDNPQLLWGINSALIVALGFFIRVWINRLEKDIEKKVDVIMCAERHGDTVQKCSILFKHRHASSGEVIIS